jgi:hypothetical protein
MMRWLFLILACTTSVAFAAQEVELGCKRLRIALDPHLSPAVVERDWGSGQPRTGAPATLELVGCNGQVLDRSVLASSLAQIDPLPVRGAPSPSFLVSADLTAEAGSYNGPLTIPIQVIGEKLVPAVARSPDGRSEPVRLSLTGKSAWRRVSSGRVDELFLVSCKPEEAGFVTTYRRYSPSPGKWRVRTHTHAGLWESDGEFPDRKFFP